MLIGAKSLPKVLLNLAFDHELHLGGVTRSFEEDLFAPTRRLLDAASTLSVPVTLFTDVMCAVRFRSWDSRGFALPYQEQLVHALDTGHDVQLHIHPHWVDVANEGGKFRASSRYSLHDFRTEQAPNDIPGIIRRSVDHLVDCCSRADRNYRCVAFRAGGLNIAPSTGQIVRQLLNSGIRIDSSVAPGFRFDSQINNVDFSTVPDLPNWNLPVDWSPEGHSSSAANSGILEVPIATVPRNPLNNVPALARRVLRSARAPRHTGKPLYDVDARYMDKLLRLLPFSAWLLSFDYYWASADYLLKILRKYVDRVAGEGSDQIIVSTLSHPKSMGPGGLAIFREFVSLARQEFGNELEFVSFPQIADIVDV